jgi:RNA polymerase sigma-70 factor, ECF subfamily
VIVKKAPERMNGTQGPNQSQAKEAVFAAPASSSNLEALTARTRPAFAVYVFTLVIILLPPATNLLKGLASLGQPDEAGFLKLIEENRPKILKICRAYAWNPFDRDDLYQEILFQIWRALPGLKENAYAGTWLYRVALNTSISFVRKHARRNRSATPWGPDDLARQIESTREPGKSDDGRLARLYEAIAQLNEAEKALVVLFLEDLSYDEIADALGLSVNHVGVALHRVKKKLSALMKEAVHE